MDLDGAERFLQELDDDIRPANDEIGRDRVISLGNRTDGHGSTPLDGCIPILGNHSSPSSLVFPGILRPLAHPVEFPSPGTAEEETAVEWLLTDLGATGFASVRLRLALAKPVAPKNAGTEKPLPW